MPVSTPIAARRPNRIGQIAMKPSARVETPSNRPTAAKKKAGAQSRSRSRRNQLTGRLRIAQFNHHGNSATGSEERGFGQKGSNSSIGRVQPHRGRAALTPTAHFS